MGLKERTIRELETLGPDDLLRIHEWILLLKRRSAGATSPGGMEGFAEVQRLLASCPGELADDVTRDREERG
ncbi:MAG: hypothetical protein GX442_18645 [Candidatus Riflebacteria bacterium]|nr:hypothetical protein [Candidatus Riflebacteria bacterium]